MSGHRSRFTFNVLANYAGTIWTGGVQLLLVPLYVRVLGAEAYGLIGLFATLQALGQVLDLGLSPTVNREMARGAARGPPGPEQRDLLRTLEWLYAAGGLALGLAVALASPVIASRWVNLDTIPPAEAARAIALMGATLAFEWPLACYRGALLGLERQGLVNFLAAASATLFGLGATVFLFGLAPSVVSLFAWRAVVSLVHTGAARALLWRPLQAREAAPPRFSLTSLAGVWRFSAGMTGITITAIALMQVDKVVLSKVLPLKVFGYYMAASTIAGMLPVLVGPIFVAAFPMLSGMVAASDTVGQRREFHVAAQLVTTIVHPAAATLALFSGTALLLWTRDPALAAHSGPALTLLATGAILNSVMVVPYALQLAHGWTRVGVTINLALVGVAVPYTVWAAGAFGVVGAASSWAVLNAIYVGAAAPPTLRRLLPGEGRRWLVLDVLVPLGAAIAAASSVKLVVPRTTSTAGMLATLALSAALSFGAALGCAPEVRDRLRAKWAAIRG
jgi:O-antigen/teichoic acid export membrane protein